MTMTRPKDKVFKGLSQQAGGLNHTYYYVRLSKENRKKFLRVAGIVAAAFIGPRPDGLHVNHKDGDRHNNAAANLEYVTRRQNEDHAVAHLLHAWGERHGMRKLTEQQVRWIRSMRNVVTRKAMAKSLMAGAVRVYGSSFDLQVQRHRLFLSNVPLRGSECHHEKFPLDLVSGKPRPWGVYYAAGDSIPKGGRTARNVEHGRELFGVTRPLKWDELKEGFPPIYTSFIGTQVRAALAVAA